MKTLIWGGMIIGSLIGGYIPILFGASWLSFAAVLGNGLGGLLGIFVGYQLGNFYELN